MLLYGRRRRKARRRRSRRNPVGSSAAYRARFPKSMGPRRIRRRRGGSRSRRRTLSIRRYRLRGGRAGLAVRARKIYVSRRGRKAAIIVARNPRRRRRSYRMNPLGGNIMSQVKGVFSKENLTIAAGGVGAGLGLHRQFVDVHVARRDHAPERGDADHRLLEVRVGEADRA